MKYQNKSLNEALEELKSRCPLMLDATTDQQGTQQTFTDDHLFTIAVPAWVLRTIKHTTETEKPK